MKNVNLKIVLLTIAALALLASCDVFFPDPIEIEGTWDLGAEWEITDDTYTVTNDPSWNWDYSGDVISYSNDSYNLASENPDSGDFGHMVIKCTSHEGGDSYEGTYTVVRWNTLTTDSGVTTMQFSEGYNASAESFTSAGAAASGATDSAGYFDFFSTATKQ